VVKKGMQCAILDYFKNFTDLQVTVNETFLSEDGTRLAIQWDWTVTRKRDGKRATTHHAILVHLVGGKIATWNEGWMQSPEVRRLYVSVALRRSVAFSPKQGIVARPHHPLCNPGLLFLRQCARLPRVTFLG